MFKKIVTSFPSFLTRIELLKTCHMDVKLRDIFLASVDAVTPRKLVSGSNLLSFASENDREIIAIRQKDKDPIDIDITDKKVHIGELISRSNSPNLTPKHSKS